MRAFVLKKEYSLQLPSSYMDIDREEMEYIDGGAEKRNYWWGWDMNLYGAEVQKMANLLEFNLYSGGGVGALGAAIAGAFPMIGGALAIAGGIYAINIMYVKTVLANADGKNATISKNMAGYSVNLW